MKLDISGGEYIGEVKDGIPHGKGKVTWQSGSFYKGEWKDGAFDGRGIFVLGFNTDPNIKVPFIEMYEGEYQGGMRHGKGILTKFETETIKGKNKMEKSKYRINKVVTHAMFEKNKIKKVVNSTTESHLPWQEIR